MHQSMAIGEKAKVHLSLQLLLANYFSSTPYAFDRLQYTDKCIFNIENSALGVLSAIDDSPKFHIPVHHSTDECFGLVTLVW